MMYGLFFFVILEYNQRISDSMFACLADEVNLAFKIVNLVNSRGIG